MTTADISRIVAELDELIVHHVEQNRLKGRDESRSKTLRLARSVRSGLEAIAQQPSNAVPDGYVLVPIVPTEEMMDAWNSTGPSFEDAYAAMLAAAQEQP